MENQSRELARILKVLAVETRVRIVQILQNRALCVNALACRLKITQGAVSQHLRIMRDNGLVIDEKRGYYVHYRLNEETLATWRTQINELLEPKTGPCIEKGDRRCAAKIEKKTSVEDLKT